jgi:Tetrapyrrole (Corrin/Porphyrin) Methylases
LDYSMDSADKLILVAGTGIAWPGQMTLEAIDLLERCTEIWTILPEKEIHLLPGKLPALTKSLSQFYHQERPRMENYLAATRHVLDRCIDLGRVGYLTQGHPVVFDSVSKAIIQQAPQIPAEVIVLPGISSIDTIINDVLYDPSAGLQIYEATSFVRKQIVVDPRGALLLLQPWVFGTAMPRFFKEAPGPDLHPLKDYLLRWFAADHSVSSVCSATSHSSLRITTTTIEALPNLTFDQLRSSTLFIPPTLGRQIE